MLCTNRRRVQRRSQGTTLRDSDLHNARVTILDPIYNMEYKISKNIRQNKMWNEADTPCINLTLNRWNAGFEMYRSALDHNSYFFMYKG